MADNGFKLGVWIADRRRARKRGRLTPHQIDQLDELGMAWDPRKKA